MKDETTAGDVLAHFGLYDYHLVFGDDKYPVINKEMCDALDNDPKFAEAWDYITKKFYEIRLEQI